MINDKVESYKKLLVQAKSLLLPSDHRLSRMANCVALVKEEFSWHWVGFYLVSEEQGHLYLGPFQGPIACTQIPFDKGVCGSSYTKKQTIVVDDVEMFAGHITCSPLSRSEIVVPILTKEGEVSAVFDIDSDKVGSFDSIDQKYLEELMTIVL